MLKIFLLLIFVLFLIFLFIFFSKPITSEKEQSTTTTIPENESEIVEIGRKERIKIV